jgi:hypothetical protein
VDPLPFGHQKGLMRSHYRQYTPGVATGHSVAFSDGDGGQLNHELAIVFPAMHVRRLMIARVDPHVEAAISKNGWHKRSIS